MKTALSPRDIQTRIRAGESLEDVGRMAGIPLDRVERFAAPVLAEREHIAAVAMSASVRRRGETSGHRSLRITVTERLVSRGVDIDTIAWDSYRLDDGRWAVTADYRSGEADRHATLHLRPAQPVLGRRPTTRPVGCWASSPRPRVRSPVGADRPTPRPSRGGHRADGGPERRAGPGPGDPEHPATARTIRPRPTSRPSRFRGCCVRWPTCPRSSAATATARTRRGSTPG